MIKTILFSGFLFFSWSSFAQNITLGLQLCQHYRTINVKTKDDLPEFIGDVRAKDEFPVSLGVNLGYAFSDRISISAQANITPGEDDYNIIYPSLNSIGKATATFVYIQFPIDLRFKLTKNSYSPYLIGGIEYAKNIGEYSYESTYKNKFWSLRCGVGMDFNLKWITLSPELVYSRHPDNMKGDITTSLGSKVESFQVHQIGLTLKITGR